MPALLSRNHTIHAALLIVIASCMSPLAQADAKPQWVGETLDGEKCVGSNIPFGPYDYLLRANFPAELDVVERAHFTPDIENLEAGRTSYAINDIAYTLMAWPNHHRALHSAMKYRMMHWEWPEDAQVPPAECQMQRAIGYSPKDPIPYMMYGLLLHKAEQYEKALFAYRQANRLRPDDILTLYNMGLTLVELEQFDEARLVANTVYGAGIPLPGLKNKLIAAGQWGTPSAVPADAPAPVVTVETREKPAGKTGQ
ncbi:MAG: tetratricopeptide repeat protein [Halioglobus sp.]|nr:tetratricopeptide repeat protein [Halioglobus sp.]